MSRHERPKTAVLSKSTRRIHRRFRRRSVDPEKTSCGWPELYSRRQVLMIRKRGTGAKKQDGLATPDDRNRNRRARCSGARRGPRRAAKPCRAARRRGALPPCARVCRRLRLDRRGARGKPSPRAVFWQLDLHLGIADWIDLGVPFARLLPRGTTRRPTTGGGGAVRGGRGGRGRHRDDPVCRAPAAHRLAAGFSRA